MAHHTASIEFSTRGDAHLVDITRELQVETRKSGIKHGILTVFVPGATGAITTIEYEPGLVKDLPAALERLFPKDMHYSHHDHHDDGNGHSHVRASFLKPSLTIPVVDGDLPLGTWQQVIFVDLDNRPRERKLIVQILGE
jgi:secondary thiamine-phosphate synthase enzyme